MSEVMIAKGKTIKKAIELGLKAMGLTASQVEIEILQSESTRFLGVLGSKPAVVRLSKKQVIDEKDTGENSPPFASFEQGKEEVLGEIWVKDEEIFVKETAAHYPTISPTKGISLYKNGELVRKTTEVMAKDLLKVELPNEEKKAVWSIQLDPLKVEAILQIEPGYKRTYYLVNQEPSPHLQLEIQQNEEIFNPLQLEDIDLKMKELGIKKWINPEEINKAMEAKKPGEFIIAKGVFPQKGEDGWLEFFVDTEWKVQIPDTVDNEEIDYRKLYTGPTVQKGKLLGIIHPPKQGKTGFAVTGEAVVLDPPKEVNVHAKMGVDIIDNGTRIVAIESGRPSIKVKGERVRVSVIPRIIFPNDIDSTTGNISYYGDIEVHGNVKERMSIESLADVLISGTISQADIKAGNRLIVCKNVVNSQLTAGKSNQMIAEINKKFSKLIDSLKSFTTAVEQIYQSPVFKTSDISKMGLSSLNRILLEKKFKALPYLINETSSLISNADQFQILGPEFKEIQADLINGFVELAPSQFKKPEDILALVERIEALQEISKPSSETNAHIIIPNAINSELYSDGDITIVGDGCIFSRIHANGKVHIKGVFRGGEVYAAGGIEINEAGTKGGEITRIRVAEGQTIRINEVAEGTRIQIGIHSHQFESTDQNVFARVTDHGRLQLF